MAKKPGKPRGKDRTDAASVATKERHAEWLELRRKGWTYDAIAAHSKVTKSTVHEAVSGYLRATVHEPAAELRQLELQRFDGLLREVMDRIEQPNGRPQFVTCKCGESVETGSVMDDKLKAVEVALKVGDQRAKLLGLNAPTKIQDVTPPREDMWARVKDWFANPTPELVAMLAEAGWERKKAS